MSVYRTKATPFYVYDFWLNGRRFYGSTGCSNERDAKAVEKRKRDEARAELSAPPPAAGMTLDEACERYWVEVGQHHARPDQTEWSLAYLIEHLGKDTLLSAISGGKIAEIVAKRRGEFVINRAAETVSKHQRRRRPRKEPKRVSPSTVNRSVTEPLRKLLTRAREVWGDKTIQPIPWRTLMLKEPQERIRPASDEEEARLFAALNPRYHDIVFVTLRLGLRLAEVVGLEWAAIDWSSRSITITGKGDKTATIPMPVDVRDRLQRMRLQRGAITERVFCWRPEPTKAVPEPAWRPMTTSGVDTAYGRAQVKAGLTSLRFHDLRHTAATRLVKKTGNLKMAQVLLRHEDITTTVRYAHVLHDDLRDALDAMATSSPVESPVGVMRETPVIDGKAKRAK